MRKCHYNGLHNHCIYALCLEQYECDYAETHDIKSKEDCPMWRENNKCCTMFDKYFPSLLCKNEKCPPFIFCPWCGGEIK